MGARPLWGACLLAFLAAGCGSTSVSVTSPTGSKCQVSATSTLPSAPATGGAGTINVNTNRDCTWSASSAAAWIAITSGTTGQGEGSVAFRVSENPDPSPRRGMVTVNDAQIAISQDPAPCKFTVSPTNASVPAAGGPTTIRVDANAGCAWTATSQASWIQVTSGSTGTGGGNIALSVSANTGAARSGSVTVAGQTVVVSQGAVACDATVSAATLTVGAQGSVESVAVDIGPTCQWTAASSADWIALTAGRTGTGPGQVQFSIAANASTSTRQAILTIAGRSVTVTQSGTAPIPCSYSIGSSSRSTDANAGTGSVSVSAGNGCDWTAGSNASWLTITGGANGSGNGTVNYSFAANTGPARTGTLSVAGRTFTLSQASGCSPTLSSTNQAVGAAGGTATVTVSASNGCTWTASSANPDWLTITSGTSGSGNGSVAFSAAVNGGAARTGTLTIAGQTVTVSQASGCSPALASANQAIAASGGTGSVGVTAAAGCTWTASTANPDWLTITSGSSGSGNGSVAFSVAANTGAAARTGTLTIAGQTFTVNQAAPCAFSINPTSQNVDSPGATGSVAITAGAGCTWTASSNNPDWITISGAASGGGNGVVSFSVAANSGPARTGTLTIAGQTFTVMQAAFVAPCTYSLSPTGQAVDASGGGGATTLTTGASCTWTASSTVDWIAVTSAPSGTGSSTITFSVSVNPIAGTPRTGTLTIGGQTFTVNQAGS
jgi:hypothetical protein